MEKDIVPPTEALALKELGFDEPCFTYYGNISQALFGLKGNIEFRTNTLLDNSHGKNIVSSAPTFSQAFRFFREKYNLWSMIYPRDGWNYTIDGFDESISCDGKSFHKTEMNHYEEAELECLKKLIEIVKTNEL